MKRAFTAIAICTLAITVNALADDAASGILLAPKAFRAAAEKVLPSIVRIETFGGLDAATSNDGPGEGPTTGLILSSDGLIVTSTFNFLKKPPVITVILPT